MTLVASKRTDIGLYPFQLEDVDDLEDRKSVLLAWEMGTGKTVAAIELDLRHRQDLAGKLPTLVIAPLTTLESTWEWHYNKYAPHLKTLVINPKDRTKFTGAIKSSTGRDKACFVHSVKSVILDREGSATLVTISGLRRATQNIKTVKQLVLLLGGSETQSGSQLPTKQVMLRESTALTKKSSSGSSATKIVDVLSADFLTQEKDEKTGSESITIIEQAKSGDYYASSVTSPSLELRETLGGLIELSCTCGPSVFICHWESLRLMKETWSKTLFGHIVADESHRAKSRKAQQTRALKTIRGKFKTALTGTPVTNKPYDLWSQLHWLYPQEFRSYWRFYEKYCDYEIKYPHGYHEFKGPKNEKELLQRIRPFYRRHLKKSKCCEHHPQGVQPQLPDKYFSRIWVDLTPKQRRAYDQMNKEMIAWLESQDDQKPLVAPVAIAQLVRLQQFSVAYADISYGVNGESTVSLTEPSSKLDVLIQIIEDNPNEQIVVFSQFKQLIRLASERLTSTNVPWVAITGDVAQADRRRAIDLFQSGKATVFLGTIGAGGEGITLTAASTVVFLDRDWSPAKNAQAEDRLHRIGQTNAVHVIDIMSRRTVDIGRFQKLEVKKDWIRRILGDEIPSSPRR